MISSANEFVRLRESSRREEYLRAANEEAALGVWTEVIERYPHMRSWVAYNKTVPLTILDVLAADPDCKVRMTVAMKNKLSDPLFRLLAADVDESVRQRIACNRNTPVDILLSLSKDVSKLVSSSALERLGAHRNL